MGKARNGIALIIVLWVLAILTATCLGIGTTVRFQQINVRHDRTKILLDQGLLSGIAKAKAVLKSDPRHEDTLRDIWSEQPEPFTLEFFPHQTLEVILADYASHTALVDESARMNANTASAEMLAALPNMTIEAAEAFVEYRETLSQGESALGLTGPLANPVQVLQAADYAIRKTGLIQLGDPEPKEYGVSDAARTLERYLTVFTRQRNVDADGNSRLNINSAGSDELLSRFQGILSKQKAEAIVLSRRSQPFESIGELLLRRMPVVLPDGEKREIRITRDEFRQLADRISVTSKRILIGKINVNTAGKDVLQTVPGISPEDAAAIVTARQSTRNLHSLGWLLEVLDNESFANACNYLTTRSQQFRTHVEANLAGNRPGNAKRCTLVLERDVQQIVVLYWSQDGSD